VPPKLNKLKIAPARSGQLLSAPWSFWVQGDEFYAASTAALSAAQAKISLHKSGKWLFQIGSNRKALLPRYSHGNQWVVALHVHFLIPPDPILPPHPIFQRNPSDPTLRLIEVPQGLKLRIDTYVNLESNFDVDARPFGPAYECVMRSGGHALTACTVVPFAPEDQQFMLSARAEAPSIYPRELIVHGSTSEHGNYVVVMPS
jgi:hypothetical protein